MSKLRVAVVGAGAGGLCVARHLIATPSRYEVVVFENTSQVGGTWVYHDDVVDATTGAAVHSSMYANVRTNLSKEVMAYPDYPFPDALPSYIGHQEVLHYLESYAERFKVTEQIRFSTSVTEIRPVLESVREATPSTATSALSASGSGNEQESSQMRDEPASVASPVAVNDAASCLQPSAQGGSGPAAAGTVLSSAIVPIGPRWSVTSESSTVLSMATGTENTGDDSDKCTEIFDAVFICNGHYFKPMAPSVPGLDRFRGTVIHSRDYRRPEVFRGQAVLVVGSGPSGQDICLEVSHRARRVWVAASPGKWIKSPLPSHVTMCPRLKSVDDEGCVVLADGQVLDADAIIWCTGYAYEFPFLHRSCGVSVEASQRCVRPLYQHMVHAVHPSMFFIGLPYIIVPFPLMHCQALFALAILERRHQLPSPTDMQRWQDEDRERRAALGLPRCYGHVLANQQWPYNDTLAAWAGVVPLPAHYPALYNHTRAVRAQGLETYRNENFRLRDDDQLFDIIRETVGDDT